MGDDQRDRRSGHTRIAASASRTGPVVERSSHEQRTAVVEPGSAPLVPEGELYRPAVLRPLDELRRRVKGEGPAAFGGRYALGDELGRGGMGEVWLAQDLRLDRDVAVKHLRRGRDGEHSSGPSDLAQLRFMREAQLTGSLEHPNIVPVYDLGIDESGGLFFTMKRLRGRSLAELIESGDTGSLLSRLDVFRKVCDALAFAHAHAVIHRDLKPDNVMVGEYGEVIVLDWGLGKRFGESHVEDELGLHEPQEGRRSGGSSVRDTELTQAGAVIGTPVYMAPEQALGKLDELDARTDVYALGALLYTLLTGARPFTGEMAEIMDAVRAGRFEPPSAKAPLPRELDAIVCTAMAFAPSQRYACVEDLRDDIQAFLEDRPVSVLRYSPLRRAGKWAERNRGLVMAVGFTGAAGLAGLLAVGLIHVRDIEAEQARVERALAQTEEARQTAELAKGRAQAAEREAAVRAADAQVGLARSLAQQDELIEALAKLDAASVGYAAAGADPIRANLVRAYIDGQNPAPLFRMSLPEGAAVNAIGAQGRRLAWRVGERVVVEDWVAGTRELDRELEGLAPVSLLARSVVAGEQGFVAARVRGELLELVALESGALVGALERGGARTIRLGAGARTAIVSHEDGRVQAWDTHARAAVGPRFDCGVLMRASADSRRIVCKPGETPSHIEPAHFSVWDTHTGAHIQDVPGGPAVGLSTDGRFTAHSREHDGVRLYDVDTGELVWHLDEEELGGTPRFSSDGRRMFTHGGAGHFSWMTLEGELIGRRHARGDIVQIDARGQFVVVAVDGEVQIWGTGPGAHAPTLEDGGVVRDFELIADEQLALAVSSERGVCVHDPLTGAELLRLELGVAPTAGGFDAQGRVAAASRPRPGEQGELEPARVELFDLRRSTTPLASLQLGAQPVMDLAFVHGDRELLIGQMDGEMLRWGLDEEQIIGRFEIGQCPWVLVASPDGELVYVAGRESSAPEVEVWDIGAGERVFASAGRGAAYDLALTPDGQRFSTANNRGQPLTWSLAAAEPLLEYPAHDIAAMGLAYSIDEALLYSVSYDNKGRFWDTQTQTELLLLPVGVNYPVFTRDGLALLGYGTRFELELGQREAALELGMEGEGGSHEQRTMQLFEALRLQHDWDNAARVLEWAAQAGYELPHVLAGRIAWVRGDVSRALEHFRAAQASEQANTPSLEIWLRVAQRRLEADPSAAQP